MPNEKPPAPTVLIVTERWDTAMPTSTVLADALWIADMRREMTYKHWSSDQRKIFELALKWWYEAHNIQVPFDLL